MENNRLRYVTHMTTCDDLRRHDVNKRPDTVKGALLRANADGGRRTGQTVKAGSFFSLILVVAGQRLVAIVITVK